MSHHLLSALVCGVLVFGGCDAQPRALQATPGPASYEVRGILREMTPDGRKAVIAHEAIPGYMEAMTMEFEVAAAVGMNGLVPGDAIVFRLSVTDTQGWIDQVRKTGHTPFAPPSAVAARVVETGALLPDCELVDQRGQRFRLGDLKGRALALTFIYTRCPFPDFCPRMSDRFGATQRALATAGAGGNWHLLSISIDPQHDTPERLAEYAQRYSADAARWTFATGESAEIQKLAGLFGIVVMREGAQWNHNLRTVVVDPAGRVQKVFAGNEWKPEELVAELERAMSGAP